MARWVAGGAAALCALLFAGCGLRIFGSGLLDWMQTWGTSLLFLICAAAGWARAWRVDRQRPAWVWLAIALTAWTGSNFYYAVFVAPAAPVVPSLGDIGYTIFPIAVAIGLAGYARGRTERPTLGAWLDGAIAALGVSATVSAIVFAVVSVDAGSTAAVFTTVLYPAEDIIVLAALVAIGSLLGWRLQPAGILLGLAVLIITVADTLTFGQVLAGSDVGGAWANLGWSAGAGLIAVAAWTDVNERVPRRRGAEDRVGLAAAAGIAAVALLAAGDVVAISPIATGLAAITLLAVFARLLITVRLVRSLANSRRLALTDELTGLANRRRLIADLRALAASGAPSTLTLFDLDGFKAYNDTFGHPSGDELLASLSRELRASVPAGGRAYRMGGDEFCTLVPGERPISEAPDRSLGALAAAGPGWSVTACWGSCVIGVETSEPSEALRRADRRMYDQKRRRPGAVREQVRNALLGALGEQQPGLRIHVEDVTDLVAQVSRALGMSPEEVDDTIRAAELHDIGKLAIPREILDKPGPLDEHEMAVMRTHTLIGERMLLTSPALGSVAPLVRGSHERWDGHGYPDGLAGEQIPLGARVVAVCDSFDAIVAERPYRPARSPAEAMHELRRCAGSQFDPAVVEAFAAVVGARRPVLTRVG